MAEKELDRKNSGTDTGDKSNPIPKRQFCVETDGTSIWITKCECSNLEVKEICRIILSQLGG